MQPAQPHIGQVDAQDVPRYVGFRTFARLRRRDLLGGLIHEYELAAA